MVPVAGQRPWPSLLAWPPACGILPAGLSGWLSGPESSATGWTRGSRSVPLSISAGSFRESSLAVVESYVGLLALFFLLSDGGGTV